MTVEENSKKEFFQSAGMVEFRANQNGEEIFPNPDGESIVIEITSTQTDEDFNLYTLDENSGEWNEEGKDEVVFNTANVDAIFNTFTLDENLPIPPVLEISRPHIVKLNRKNRKWLKNKKHSLQFTIEEMSNYKRINRGENFHGKILSEFKTKNPPIWIYNCLLYTSPSPRDRTRSRMPSSA